MKSEAYNKSSYRVMRGVSFWLWNFKCYFCDATSQALEAHHINGNNLDNNLQNLVPVCPACHKMVHRVSIKFHVSNIKIVSLLLQKVKFYIP